MSRAMVKIRYARRNGAVFIVVLLIITVVTAMVLVLSRTARVEAMISANQTAAVQAEQVERGAEQYLLALLELYRTSAMTMDESYFQQVSVGEGGYFWVLRPDYADDDPIFFGFVDENSKLNINTASRDTLLALGLDAEQADSIIDWRDADSSVGNSGAEDSYYLNAGGYHCKNSAFETVEELLLVKGFTPAEMYGQQNEAFRIAAMTNGVTGSDTSLSATINNDAAVMRGLINYVTVYSKEAQTTVASGGQGGQGGQTAQPRQGRINVMTAPKEVLMTLPGLTASDADQIINARPVPDEDETDSAQQQETMMQWVTRAIGNTKAGTIQSQITDQSYQFSADILAVSANGRSFRRVRVIIDATSSPRIIYRRDLTPMGWPLDPEILVALKSGQGVSTGFGILEALQ